MAYYYFCSTLPLLSFDATPPFSYQDFENDCQRHLTARDFEDLLRAAGKDDSPADNAMLKLWQEFLRCLNNEIAALRAQKKGVHLTNVLHGQRAYHGDAAAAVNEALREKNILESEKALLKAQWNYLERISLNAAFEKEYVFAYGLQLKILERLSAFRSSQGEQRLEEIRESVLHEIQK